MQTLSAETLSKLILTNCLPLLPYGIDSAFLKIEQISKLNAAFYSVFKSSFMLSQYISIKVIYNFIGPSYLNV